MIEVYDDFFDEDIHKEIFDRLIEPHWGISGGDSNKPEIFWHYDGLEEEEYFNTFLFEKICKKLGRSFKYLRIYANGQTAGQCGTPHIDEGDLTFLYYPSPVWELKFQGHLIFAEQERMIEYVSNRAVLFDAKLPHYADAPHRWFNGLRISLAYKLLKK